MVTDSPPGTAPHLPHPADVPIRQRSANGRPPARKFLRHCQLCTADFLGLAAGKTGERGLWDDGRWWCSQECYDHDHPEADHA